MRTLDELRHLGYEVAAVGDDIHCRYVGLGRPDPGRVRPWLQALKAEKAVALAALRAEAAEGWSPESLRCEARFGHRAARLYPLLGHRVRTPQGTARLEQVTEARCRVLLDDRPEHCAEVPADLVSPIPTEVKGRVG
jgi:hypothetical protein